VANATQRRRVRSDKDRERERKRIRPARICPACGAQYHPTVHRQKACTRRCALSLHEPRPQSCKLTYRDCLECGRLFISRQARTYCGETCSKAGYLKAGRAYNKGRPRKSTGTCSCGAALPSAQRKKCDGCRALAAQEQKRQERKRTRARHHRIKRERYTLAEIAKRDRYYCQLCHPKRRVAMTKAVPHPKAPTIDHVVPLGAGGADTKANVQLAHFLCNSRKSNRGDAEQLRLVG